MTSDSHAGPEFFLYPSVLGPAPDDGRGYRAVLTATGFQALRQAAPYHAQSVRELFLNHVHDDELPCIERVFTRLRSHLENDGTEKP